MPETLTARLHDEIDALETLEGKVSTLADRLLKDRLKGAVAIALEEGQPIAAALEHLLEEYERALADLTTEGFALGASFVSKRG